MADIDYAAGDDPDSSARAPGFFTQSLLSHVLGPSGQGGFAPYLPSYANDPFAASSATDLGLLSPAPAIGGVLGSGVDNGVSPLDGVLGAQAPWRKGSASSVWPPVTPADAAGATPSSGPLGSSVPASDSPVYETLKATNYDPARSNGRTVNVTPDIMRAGRAGAMMVAVPADDEEKLGYIAPLPDGQLMVGAVSGARPSDTRTTSTVTGVLPTGSVAAIHGHIDQGPNASEGMVDHPEGQHRYGDSFSLLSGIPMGTVSNGQVGWHVLANGQLQYIYPRGSMTDDEKDAMQSNLNVEQRLFRK
jgi:hypothetical protein